MESSYKSEASKKMISIGSMGLVYLPTNLPSKSTIHVGKYTSAMDPMGLKPATLKSSFKWSIYTPVTIPSGLREGKGGNWEP